MSAIGGDMIEIGIKHPNEKLSFLLFPKSGESFSFDPGGFTNDDEDNGIAGDGSTIIKKTRKRWSFEGVVRWDMRSSNDLTKYRDLEESTEEAVYTFTHSNGTVWQGTGVPVGGNGGSMGDATFTVKFAGGGRCTKVIG